MYFIFSFSFIVSKEAAIYFDPFFFVFFRMFFAALILFLILFFKKEKITIKSKDFLLFLFCGLFLIYLSFVPEFFALKNITAGIATICYSLSPFITIFLEYIIYKKSINKYHFFGLFITIFGVLFSIKNIIFSEFIFFKIGEIKSLFLLFVSVFSGAFSWFVFKKLLKKNYSPLLINAYSMLIGAFFCLISIPIFKIKFNLSFLCEKEFFIYLFLLIFITNIVSYNLYAYLTKKYSLTMISFVGFICPFFTLIMEYFFYGKKILFEEKIALIFILIGLLFFKKGEE
jgi:drug/metabolite transporter (DMT)-like permease